MEIWKPLLGLSDWNISVRLVSRKAWKKSSDGSFANGQCHADVHSQTAELWIIEPDDYIPEYNEQKYNPEYLLLHELIHIPLEYFSGRDFDCSEYYDSRNIMREQFINRMARTLLTLSKGGETRAN